jgi:hypothetical protein
MPRAGSTVRVDGADQLRSVTRTASCLWLLGRYWIRRRKGVLEGFVERLFLVQALAFLPVVIILLRFALRLSSHLAPYIPAQTCRLLTCGGIICLTERGSRLFWICSCPQHRASSRQHPAASMKVAFAVGSLATAAGSSQQAALLRHC